LGASRPSGASGGRHIAAEIEWNTDIDEITSLSGKTYFDIKLMTDLTFTVNASYDERQYYNISYENKFVGDGAPGGRASREHTRRTTVGFNQLLNYSKSFDKHNFKALLAHESLDYTINQLYGSRAAQIAD